MRSGWIRRKRLPLDDHEIAEQRAHRRRELGLVEEVASLPDRLRPGGVRVDHPRQAPQAYLVLDSDRDLAANTQHTPNETVVRVRLPWNRTYGTSFKDVANHATTPVIKQCVTGTTQVATAVRLLQEEHTRLGGMFVENSVPIILLTSRNKLSQIAGTQA